MSNSMLPPVLDPAFANRDLTLVTADGVPLLDPRTGEPFRFTSKRAAIHQAYALKLSMGRIALR